MGEVRRAQHACVGAVEDERGYAVGIGRGEQGGHGPAFGDSEEGCPLAADRVEDRTDVRHRLLEGRRARGTVGQALTALVEEDQAREGREPVEQARGRRVLPDGLDVEDEARDEHEVERTLAMDLVRDADAVALCVAGRGH